MNVLVFCLSVATAVISTVIVVLCAVNIFYKKKKPYITVAIFAILLSISIPFIINETYKAGIGYLTMWRAEDALAFYGTILGAVATIVAVILTIVYMNKQNRESQVYQRKLILADINKVELSNRYSEILDYAKRITSILMLEKLETTNLLNVFFPVKITAFLHELLAINSYIDKLDISGSEAEISFVTKIKEIITKIVSVK